jgi:hypothetical protein
VQLVSGDRGVDRFPVPGLKAGIEFLFEVMIDCLVIARRRPVVDFAVEALPSVRHRTTQHKNPHGVGGFLERCVFVAPEPLRIVMNEPVAVSGIVAPKGVRVAKLARPLAVGTEPVKLNRTRGELGGAEERHNRGDIPDNDESGPGRLAHEWRDDDYKTAKNLRCPGLR